MGTHMNHVRLSKFLSLVLRHDPGQLGAQGYVDVEELLAALVRAGWAVTRQDLGDLVATNAKRRFAFSSDGMKIRASQGHSVEIDLGYMPRVPPALLHHGTARRFLPRIEREGLLKMSRQHVHLTELATAARTVGARHGEPVVLQVDAEKMHGDGFTFYQSANGVWLVGHVPACYLRRL